MPEVKTNNGKTSGKNPRSFTLFDKKFDVKKSKKAFDALFEGLFICFSESNNIAKGDSEIFEKEFKENLKYYDFKTEKINKEG